MTPEGPTDANGPELAVELAWRSSTADQGVWDMAWDVHNITSEPLRILSVWLPHGRFRSPRRTMEPALVVGSGEHVRLDFTVHCREGPGTVVENCFVILNVDWSAGEWQAFARLTVSFDDEGAPQPETVLITSQRTGFAHNT